MRVYRIIYSISNYFTKSTNIKYHNNVECLSLEVLDGRQKGCNPQESSQLKCRSPSTPPVTSGNALSFLRKFARSSLLEGGVCLLLGKLLSLFSSIIIIDIVVSIIAVCVCVCVRVCVCVCVCGINLFCVRHGVGVVNIAQLHSTNPTKPFRKNDSSSSSVQVRPLYISRASQHNHSLHRIINLIMSALCWCNIQHPFFCKLITVNRPGKTSF